MYCYFTFDLVNFLKIKIVRREKLKEAHYSFKLLSDDSQSFPIHEISFTRYRKLTTRSRIAEQGYLKPGWRILEQPEQASEGWIEWLSGTLAVQQTGHNRLDCQWSIFILCGFFTPVTVGKTIQLIGIKLKRSTLSRIVEALKSPKDIWLKTWEESF